MRVNISLLGAVTIREDASSVCVSVREHMRVRARVHRFGDAPTPPLFAARP